MVYTPRSCSAAILVVTQLSIQYIPPEAVLPPYWLSPGQVYSIYPQKLYCSHTGCHPARYTVYTPRSCTAAILVVTRPSIYRQKLYCCHTGCHPARYTIYTPRSCTAAILVVTRPGIRYIPPEAVLPLYWFSPGQVYGIYPQKLYCRHTGCHPAQYIPPEAVLPPYWLSPSPVYTARSCTAAILVFTRPGIRYIPPEALLPPYWLSPSPVYTARSCTAAILVVTRPGIRYIPPEAVLPPYWLSPGQVYGIYPQKLYCRHNGCHPARYTVYTPRSCTAAILVVTRPGIRYIPPEAVLPPYWLSPGQVYGIYPQKLYCRHTGCHPARYTVYTPRSCTAAILVVTRQVFGDYAS
ncbi:uncharacterized protein LOC120979326 [Bufo bufo]|uniref:uncharacterized protein LOC120979326 n=1 Tax=Bufo bufo TaxID=8384 RepID=UPI001ABE1451|nr:uncharacterized protein LOC120979326 [Bufo bufo]